MGTRHLIVVKVDGENKIAQYGQWDGYPSGAGVDVLRFAQKIAGKSVRKNFADKVRACSWVTDEKIKSVNKQIESGEIKDWTKMYPEWSRDTGADILNMVFENGGLELRDNITFAADSLFCEWVWVIDLDANTFEGYEGFNKRPLDVWERFHYLSQYSDGGYYPVKLVRAYSLDDLPDKATFLKDFEEE